MNPGDRTMHSSHTSGSQRNGRRRRTRRDPSLVVVLLVSLAAAALFTSAVTNGSKHLRATRHLDRAAMLEELAARGEATGERDRRGAPLLHDEATGEFVHGVALALNIFTVEHYKYGTRPAGPPAGPGHLAGTRRHEFGSPGSPSGAGGARSAPP